MSSDQPKPLSGRAQKRSDYIEWAEYFMGAALLAAQRSKDPSTQVGSCIVNEENVIVGTGYNGMPRGCSDDTFPWGKESTNPLDNKFPCCECAKAIIQKGIRHVVYLRDKPDKNEHQASRMLFEHAGVLFE